MKLETVQIDEKQKIIIISKKHYPFIDLLKSELKKYNALIFLSPVSPKEKHKFDYCFFINQTANLNKYTSKQKLIFIFFNQKQGLQNILKKEKDNVRVIEIKGDDITKKDIDKILWFTLSKNKEQFLFITVRNKKKNKLTIFQQKKFNIFPKITVKRTIFSLIFLFFISHILFLFPLSLSSYFFYQSAIALKNENMQKTKQYLKFGDKSLFLTKKLYSFSRPTLLLFSLALMPDTVIDINQKTNDVLDSSISLSENAKQIFKLVLNKKKNKEQKENLIFRIKILKRELKILNSNLSSLNQKLPSNLKWLQTPRKEIASFQELLSKINTMMPHIDNLMAKEDEKKYLLLFANNMELRPGGGFIGSFAILTMKNYTLQDLKIYDVYDADGQLQAHVEPPKPIREHLNQPHWYLRDSAFSPDFLENYAQAKYFLEKEMGFEDFSGAFLITTKAIENILAAFENVYLPDYDESINQKNFYLKAQIHSEKDFFPGSIQKKSFLSSLTRNLILNVENASILTIAKQLKKSLDEKQLVLYIDNTETQKLIDSFYWSGRIFEPKCTSNSNNCVPDYFFPVDANLGVNKANFFIKRSIHFKTKINSNGEISHILTIQFKNESPSEVFPGGTYKNYFQLFLPKDATIKEITKDDILVEDSDYKNEVFTIIGFLFKVPPKKTTKISISYKIDNKIKKGKGVYQLIAQKQIGSSNNDFALEIIVPKNIFITNKNFSPVVKDNQIVYNTSLSADKIFYIELIKE